MAFCVSVGFSVNFRGLLVISYCFMSNLSGHFSITYGFVVNLSDLQVIYIRYLVPTSMCASHGTRPMKASRAIEMQA